MMSQFSNVLEPLQIQDAAMFAIDVQSDGIVVYQNDKVIGETTGTPAAQALGSALLALYLDDEAVIPGYRESVSSLIFQVAKAQAAKGSNGNDEAQGLGQVPVPTRTASSRGNFGIV